MDIINSGLEVMFVLNLKDNLKDSSVLYTGEMCDIHILKPILFAHNFMHLLLQTTLNLHIMESLYKANS